MTWRLVPAIGLLAGLIPASAQAQTNLDQGKSASQIFAAACAECHKAPRALANGKTTATLAEFLGEHYTTSREQAAALAAYVMGGRGSEPIGRAAQGPGRKPAAEPASASAEEPKPERRPKPAKPNDGASANVKPKEEEIPSLIRPIIRPEGEQNRPAAATRGHRKEPKVPESPQEPGPVARTPPVGVVEPARKETPTPTVQTAPTPAAPTLSDVPAGDAAPVPRDNVPD